MRDNGRWFSIAKLSRLSEQATLRFTAGAVEGHLVRRGGEVMALSAICSDLPCTLVWQEKEDNFLCPCHDVLFDAQGEAKLTRRPVPPLTRLDVKVEGDDILVWSIGEDGPRQPGRPSPEEYEG